MTPNIITLAAMFNGMMSTSFVLLPALYLKAGIINSIIITIITGIVNFYSGKLTYIHIHPKQENFPIAINRHLKKKVFSFYDLFSILSDELLFYVLFNLLAKQWKSIFYQYQGLQQFIPYIVAITLFIWNLTFIKLNVQLNVMATGIISAFLYTFFLIWIYITRPLISETGRHFQLVTIDVAPLAGNIAVSITIQTIFIQILKKNTDFSSNIKLLSYAYFMSTLFYIYIGILGGYALLGRKPFFKQAESISDFFTPNTLAPLLIEFLVFVYIYSVQPEWLVINKQRVLNILKVENNNVNQMTYLIANHVLCCIFYVIGVQLNTLLSIAGGIFFFFTIYVIPIYVHIKCVYYHEKQSKDTNDVPYITLNEQQNDIDQIRQELQQNKIYENEQIQQLQCQCTKIRESYVGWQVYDLIILSFMFLFGVVVLGLTLYDQFIKKFL